MTPKRPASMKDEITLKDRLEADKVRMRIPELLAERGWTAYELAKRSGGRLSLTWCYNVVANDGAWSKLTPIQLSALVTVLNVDPGRLFGGLMMTPEQKRMIVDKLLEAGRGKRSS